jgi:ABC-type glutathione transport system ATPase component
MQTRFILKNVSKHYPGRNSSVKKALDNLDLEIHDKTINALMGKSGCGKSTLTRIISRLEPPDSGLITYKGKDIEATPLKEFRRENQVMFQNPLLSVNPHFKIKKVLQEPLVINHGELNKHEIEEKTMRLLDLLEISPRLLNRCPSELSGGELQRVVLGRALILEPEFLILDEPFSALDEIMAARLIRSFKKIFRRLGISVLYISHHLKRVSFLADRLAIMENGRIRNVNENW